MRRATFLVADAASLQLARRKIGFLSGVILLRTQSRNPATQRMTAQMGMFEVKGHDGQLTTRKRQANAAPGMVEIGSRAA